VQELNGRKRKAAPSPAAPQEEQALKRPTAPAAVGITVRVFHDGTSSTQLSKTLSMHRQGEPLWEDYAAEGDTPQDCLGQKLSIKKRDSAAAVKEVTLAYIKRLRALGWHLYHQSERCGGAEVACLGPF
jgi:hypothetical protein